MIACDILNRQEHEKTQHRLLPMNLSVIFNGKIVTNSKAHLNPALC